MREANEIIKEFESRVAEVLYRYDFIDTDIVCIVPRKEVDVLRELTVRHITRHIPMTNGDEVIKVCGVKTIPADVDRIYVCLD